MTYFDSDHPDRSQKCYPCYCPDCPGYHFCNFYYQRLAYGEEASCDVCGQSVRYESFSEEDMKDKHLSQTIKDRFYAGDPVGGKYITLVERYK